MIIKPGDIIIKDTTVFRGLMERRFDSMLINVLLYIADKYGIFMTESYRIKKHNDDLHGVIPVQAVDLRTRSYNQHILLEIERDVHSQWCYDPERPKMVVFKVHDSGQGLHAHVQVHQNTQRIRW